MARPRAAALDARRRGAPARRGARRCRCLPAGDGSIFRTSPYGSFSPRSTGAASAFLDRMAVEAQGDPRVRVYVLVYAGRSAAEAARYRRFVREWLVGRRGLEAGRVTVTDAGPRDDLTLDLFLFPAGMRPPAPQPTRAPCAPRGRRGRRLSGA